MIKCVIYDLDDTLYDFNAVNLPAFDTMCQEASRRFDIPAKTFGDVFATAYRAVGDRMPQDILDLEPEKVDVAAVHSRTLRLSYTLNTLNLPLFPHVLELYDVYWNYILEHMKQEPHIEEVMQALKAQGIRIGLGTNMTARMQYRKVYHLGLGSYLDFVTTSDETIFDKPDPRFFDLVVKKAGCERNECLFIGDNYRYDYGGAVASGLNGLWYNRLEKPWNHVTEEEKQEAKEKDVVITDHREVLARLKDYM
ncbi:MAG: HAD family hydrolase [Firmicutes bacterium]|nr:HAD family hydrolase [Bacillota bacterium]